MLTTWPRLADRLGDDASDRGRHHDVEPPPDSGCLRASTCFLLSPEEQPLAGRLDFGGMAGMDRRDLFELLPACGPDVDELLRALAASGGRLPAWPAWRDTSSGPRRAPVLKSVASGAPRLTAVPSSAWTLLTMPPTSGATFTSR